MNSVNCSNLRKLYFLSNWVFHPISTEAAEDTERERPVVDTHTAVAGSRTVAVGSQGHRTAPRGPRHAGAFREGHQEGRSRALGSPVADHMRRKGCSLVAWLGVRMERMGRAAGRSTAVLVLKYNTNYTYTQPYSDRSSIIRIPPLTRPRISGSFSVRTSDIRIPRDPHLGYPGPSLNRTLVIKIPCSSGTRISGYLKIRSSRLTGPRLS